MRFSPFVETPLLLSLLAMSKRYCERPSVLVGEEDRYAAYCLDEACGYIFCKIEETGRLPAMLEQAAMPTSSMEAVTEAIGRKGVDFVDYRRNHSGISDP